MGANDLLTLTRGTLTIDLYSWIHGNFQSGHEALKGITGFGLPPQTNRWFEGAGNGATYRGSRVLPRPIFIPILTKATNRANLDALLSQVAQALRPNGTDMARLNYKDGNGQTWFVNVVREEGGDYVRDKTFNRQKYLHTTLTLKAGDPFWTREATNHFSLQQDDSGRGLLPYLANLEVSSGQVFGNLTPENSGDAPAWPVWTIEGPLTGLTLTGANGEVISWSGTMIAGEKRIIDARKGTIVDENGVNKYSELGTAPQFWSIPSVSSPIQIETTGAGTATIVTAEWQPRKWSIV